MNPLDDLNQRLAAELDEYVYNIGNRPDNLWLRFMVLLQGAFCAAVGGGLVFVVGACAGVEDGYALMGLIALGRPCGVVVVCGGHAARGTKDQGRICPARRATPPGQATFSSAPWSTKSCLTAAGSGRNRAPAANDLAPPVAVA